MKKNYSKILNIIVVVGIILTLILLSGIPFILGALSKSSDIYTVKIYNKYNSRNLYLCPTLCNSTV